MAFDLLTALFRVNANAEIGIGHVMRCLALAQALEQAGGASIFLLNSEAISLCRKRHDWTGRIVEIPKDILNTQEESQWVVQQATQLSASFIVLDGYDFDESYRQILTASNLLQVCFDDNNQLPNLHADVVINGAANVTEFDYERSAPKAHKCLGDSYRVMRQEFLSLPELSWNQRHSMTITMGGSDPKHLTLPLLKALDSLAFAEPIRVVTGVAYPHLEALTRFIQGSQLCIQHIHDCQQIADVFCHSRLTLSAAGGSQFELMTCASPAILFVVADNQLNATEQAQQQGWCEAVDARNDASAVAWAQQSIALWNNEPKLRAMSDIAIQMADANGATRVAQVIAKRLNQR